MTKRLTLIVALAALLCTASVFDIARAVAGRPGVSTIGLAGEVEDGRFVVRGVLPTDLAGVPTVLSESTLRVDDALIAMTNGRGERFPATNLRAMGDALRSLHVGEPWSLLVERRDASGDIVTTRIDIDGVVPPWRSRIVSLAFTGFVPLLAIFTALLIALLRPGDDAAFTGSLLFLGLGATFSTDVLVLPSGLREVTALVNGALTTSAVYFFMRFFLLFPSAAGLEVRLPRLKQILAVPTVLLVLTLEVFTALSLSSFAAMSALDRVLPLGVVTAAYGLVFLAMFGIGLASLVTHFLGAETPGARRRLGILLAGALAGLGPLVITVVYAQLAGSDQLGLAWTLVVVAALPMFPLSFIYAVVRYRVLGVGMIVRRGVQYALVSRAVLVAEAALVFAVLFFAVGPTLSRWLPQAETGTVATLAALCAILAAMALRALNRRLRPVLDRQYFRSDYSPDEVLTEVSSTVKLLAAQPEQMVEAVAHVIGSTLHPRHVGIYLSSGRTGQEAPGHGEARHALVSWLAVDETTGELWPVTHRPSQVVLPDDELARVFAASLDEGQPVIDVALDPGDRWVEGAVTPGQATTDAVDADAGSDAYAPLHWLGTAVVVPLVSDREVIGWISLGDKLSEEAYSKEDRRLLAAIGGQLGMALAYAQLIAIVAEQEAMRRELEIARQVQAELFPQFRPQVAGLEYAGSCRTAQEVGGDYYDFLDLGPGRVGLAAGDVAGKGISAALLMASLQAMLRSRAPLQATRLDLLLQELNRLMVTSTAANKFATLFYAVYEAETRTLSYVNAGHNPPMLFADGAVAPVSLMPTGMAMGLSIKATYAEVSRPLTVGDLLVIYTDGVTEAMNRRGDDFGEDRLAAVVTEHRHRTVDEIHEAILSAVEGFVDGAPPHDDITLVVARVGSV